MAELKLKFDATLEYQRQAIQNTVDLFAGMPMADTQFSLTSRSASSLAFTELGVANPILDDQESFEEVVLQNLQAVQERSGIPKSATLGGMNFSIEMETGTGKTYVYLRTLFELHKAYGFRKFVIVVPSVAIREGTLANIELLRGHFKGIYLEEFDAELYDSSQLTRVRHFASTDTIQILIMNIQAFQKDVEEEPDSTKANIINRAQDRMSGRRPIEFIQATRPVVVVDEPQNMESSQAVSAIERLRPFCTLRYSATHKKPYNMIYRLGPVDAYDLGLVKRIEVASVVADDNPNAAYIRLLKVDIKSARARLEINHGHGTSTKTKKTWVSADDDLFDVSGGRQEYATGFIVNNISFRPGAEAVEFTNGRDVTLGEASGSFDEDIRRAQISETVRQHLDKERSLSASDVKVLSLIFIDRVANYRTYGDDGTASLGPIGQSFEMAYTELAAQPRYAKLDLPPVGQVHGGYFSVDKKGRLKDSRGTGETDSSTYDLIMRDKERLLSNAVPLRFIFSHSALREGWDNPNVFQICTLSETRSKDRKRQEIGRGLRLPVNQGGERVRDANINRLTVIANEAYEDFARALQTEYEEDTGRQFGVVPREAFARIVMPTPAGSPPRASLGQDESAVVWDHLRKQGYLDDGGAVLDKFEPARDDFELSVPDGCEPIRAQISDIVGKYIFANRVTDARKRKRVRFRKQVTLDNDFKEFWDSISQRTRYRVTLSSDELVELAVTAIKEAPTIGPPKVRVRTVEIGHSVAGLSTDKLVDVREYETARPTWLPDILADLQNETDLTRATLVRILLESDRLGDFLVNPQEYISLVTTKVNAAMNDQMVEGLTYEPIPGLSWEMHRLEPSVGEEVERYAARLYEIQSEGKTPFDHVEIDSDVERKFAKGLDDNNSVRFFMKLPAWFTVDTPVGPYNPDWAIVFEGSQRVYLVRETKSSIDPAQRRYDENVKIECAAKHFESIDVDYAVVTDTESMISGLTS